MAQGERKSVCVCVCAFEGERTSKRAIEREREREREIFRVGNTLFEQGIVAQGIVQTGVMCWDGCGRVQLFEDFGEATLQTLLSLSSGHSN